MLLWTFVAIQFPADKSLLNTSQFVISQWENSQWMTLRQFCRDLTYSLDTWIQHIHGSKTIYKELEVSGYVNMNQHLNEGGIETDLTVPGI